MKSNPLFYDSDFDGFSDYQEVVEMKSDTFKTTIAGENATGTGSFASSDGKEKLTLQGSIILGLNSNNHLKRTKLWKHLN